MCNQKSEAEKCEQNKQGAKSHGKCRTNLLRYFHSKSGKKPKVRDANISTVANWAAAVSTDVPDITCTTICSTIYLTVADNTTANTSSNFDKDF